MPLLFMLFSFQNHETPHNGLKMFQTVYKRTLCEHSLLFYAILEN